MIMYLPFQGFELLFSSSCCIEVISVSRRLNSSVGQYERLHEKLLQMKMLHILCARIAGGHFIQVLHFPSTCWILLTYNEFFSFSSIVRATSSFRVDQVRLQQFSQPKIQEGTEVLLRWWALHTCLSVKVLKQCQSVSYLKLI